MSCHRSGRRRWYSVQPPTPEVQAALEQVLPRLFPSLHALQIVRHWAGVMGFTPDALPIVDQVKDIPGVWMAGGFSGHGMALAARLGQLLAESITSASIPAALSLFRLDRETLISS
jgi:gamma-glutamylputrescine oxidase